MNLDEAYEFAMQMVEEIKSAGVEVIKTPSKSRTIASILKEFDNQPDRLPSDKWFRVTFKTNNPEHLKMISEKAKIIGWRGIAFDTSGCKGERDWSLDWSFHLTGTPDGEMEAGRDTVEDILTKLESSSNQCV